MFSRYARWTRHRDASQQEVPDLIGHPACQDDSQDRRHPVTRRSLNIIIQLFASRNFSSFHFERNLKSRFHLTTIFYKNCSRFQNWRCQFVCIFWICIGRLWYCHFSWFNADSYLQYFVQWSVSFQLRNAETTPTRIFLLTMQIILLIRNSLFLIWRSHELSPLLILTISHNTRKPKFQQETVGIRT